MIKAIDALGQFLQIIGIVLSAPGLWIEEAGKRLERKAVRLHQAAR